MIHFSLFFQCYLICQYLLVVGLYLLFLALEALQVDIEQWCDLVDYEFDLLLAKLHRLVVTAKLDDAFICERVVVFAHEDVGSCELVKLPDSFSIVADDEGCDLIGNRDEGMWSWKWIDLQLLLELSLLLSLLLK